MFTWRLEHGHLIRMKLSTEVLTRSALAPCTRADNPSEGESREPKKDPAKRTSSHSRASIRKELILRECDLFYCKDFESNLTRTSTC
jgi:hypothetical protein